MRRVVIRGILLLIVIAWLAGAGVMLFFDPQAPQHVPFEALILGGDAARVLGYGGYVHARSVGYGPQGDAPAIRSILKRSALDRDMGFFALSLYYVTNEVEPVLGVDLAVASEDLALDDASWAIVGNATLGHRGAWQMAEIANVNCPADTSHYRVRQRTVHGYGDIFMATMPQAPTFLGRVHDTIGHWPLFSWIPQLK